MRKRSSKVFFPLLLLIVAGSFLLLFSTATSPLYPNNYGVDSAFYRVIGKSILQGKTLYTDIWDNKGPLLFFIQAIGALTGTRNGEISLVFILQIAAVFLTVLFMYQTDSLAGRRKFGGIRFLLIVFSALTVLCVTMEGGNLCEEWSLPFISCSLYLFAAYALRAETEPKHPAAYAFIHGICFASIAFIRINNAVSICAGILVIGFFLILKKQWENILRNILFGLLGILAVALPILTYFYAKHALGEMINGVFLHNLKYVSGDSSHTAFEGTDLLVRCAPASTMLLILLTRMIRKRSVRLIDALALVITAGNAAALWYTNKYLHYFTVIIPVFMFILLLYTDFDKIPEFILALAVTVFFIGQDAAVFSRLPELHSMPPKYASAEQIPVSEKRSSIAVWVKPDIYLNTGFEPCTRFCAYQFIHFPVNPPMLEEFLSDLKSKQPSWIMVLSGYEGIYPELEEILNADYDFRFTEDNTDFFRRNGI